LIDENGNRLIDTFLGATSAAYSNMIRGLDYAGDVNIMGKPYLSLYRPIKNQNEIIGILFIGIEMQVIYDQIMIARNKQIVSSLIEFIIIFIIVMVIMVVFLKFTLKPLIQVVAALKDIYEGDADLTKRIQSKAKDEIGEHTLIREVSRFRIE